MFSFSWYFYNLVVRTVAKTFLIFSGEQAPFFVFLILFVCFSLFVLNFFYASRGVGTEKGLNVLMLVSPSNCGSFAIGIFFFLSFFFQICVQI